VQWKISVVDAFQPKISRNSAGNFCLQRNSANLNISRIFGSAGFFSLKIWLQSLPPVSPHLNDALNFKRKFESFISYLFSIAVRFFFIIVDYCWQGTAADHWQVGGQMLIPRQRMQLDCHAQWTPGTVIMWSTNTSDFHSFIFCVYFYFYFPLWTVSVSLSGNSLLFIFMIIWFPYFDVVGWVTKNVKLYNICFKRSGAEIAIFRQIYSCQPANFWHRILWIFKSSISFGCYWGFFSSKFCFT